MLTDTLGDPWPAGELLVPDAPLAAVLAADVDRPFVGAEWTDRYAVDVLVAAGVRSGFGVVRSNSDDPDGADGSDPRLDDLPDLDEWLARQDGDPQITALTDLDLVDPDRWPAALELIAGDRDARAALAPTGAGLSYSGWWISRHALIHGRPPIDWRLADALDLQGLYDPLPLPMDETVASWIGVRSGLAAAVADDPFGVLDRLGDPDRSVPVGSIAAITSAVADVLDSVEADLPSGVRAVSGEVVDAGDACVLDEPWWAQLVPAARLVPGGRDPAQVARVLDLPLASTHFAATVLPDGGLSVRGIGRPQRASRAGRDRGRTGPARRCGSSVHHALRVSLDGSGSGAGDAGGSGAISTGSTAQRPPVVGRRPGRRGDGRFGIWRSRRPTSTG